MNRVIEYASEYQTINLDVFRTDKGIALPGQLQSFVTQALWADGELWYSGDFNLEKFHRSITETIEYGRRPFGCFPQN